ncbi:MAG: hypothetical protein ACYS3N_15880 [Planctomycetota bacterium]|jgi:hypothetical protein
MKSSIGIKLAIVASILVVIVCGASVKRKAISQKTAWEYKIVSQASLAGIKSMEDVWSKAFGENGAFSFEGAEKLNAEVAAKMNLLGKEGWELVCFNEKSGFIFKRKK